jgi:hypothetical protein
MTIASVTAGTLITPAWGNSVADAINLIGQTCIVKKTGISVPNGSNTGITSWTAEYDPDSWLSGGAVIVPVDGIYLQNVEFKFNDIAADKRSIIYMIGNFEKDTGRVGGTLGYASLKQTVSAVAEVSALSSLPLTVWQNGGALTSCEARMTATLLRPL